MKNEPIEVVYSVKFVAKVQPSEDVDIMDSISDIDIPENDQCKYVKDSFELISIDDYNVENL